MFENMKLWRIFGSKEKVTEDWEEMHNEGRHNLHLSSNTEIVKSREIRWAGHAAYIGKMKNDVYSENLGICKA
jgi:hypothetical protein